MKETNEEYQEENLNTENLSEDQLNEECNDNTNDNLAEDIDKKFAELNDSYLRLHAEYDNYRKRSMKEKADLLKSGGEKAILGVLPIIDDFERALPNITDEVAKEGFTLIYNKFKAYLAQNGVKEIETIGKPFDTELHEAITTIPAQSDDQKNTVIDCVEKGYTLNDKVIRFAKVIIAK